jgi:peroxiredoxin (alkyl hydroperoxide reductase subunit C)
LENPRPRSRHRRWVKGEFKEVKLEDYKGKWLVLYFYPLDFTFV